MRRIQSAVLSLLVVVSILFAPIVSNKVAASTNGVEDFVTRLYNVCLDRNPDPAGLGDWTSKLRNHEATGVSAAYGFIFSAEFQNKQCTNDQYVTYMYSAFFGRNPDPEGMNTWVTLLNNGATREFVFCGFANSVEFDNLCKSYGIIRGFHIEGQSFIQVGMVNLFVERLYNEVLGRSCDSKGMADWTTLLVNHTYTGSEAAAGFVFSEEFINKKLNNSAYLDVLYHAFMGRDPDSAGKSMWLNLLNTGTSREEVFNGFVGSAEFTDICERYGIVRGNGIPVPPPAPEAEPVPCGSVSTINTVGPDYSYLFDRGNSFERVEWYDSNLLVETFTKDFVYVGGKTIDKSLLTPSGSDLSETKFGSVYYGSQYNFVLTGVNNIDEDNNKIVIRVTKFDKEWNYLGKCELSNNDGVTVYSVFSFSAVGMAEVNGQLYIGYGRLGFDTGDGLHHQGKQNLIINISDMSYVAGTYNYWHSFAQYMTVCNNMVYQAELSDGTRSIFVENQIPSQYKNNWGGAAAGGDKSGDVIKFWRTNAYGVWSYSTYTNLRGVTSSNTKNTLITYGDGYNIDHQAMTDATKDLDLSQISDVVNNFTSGKQSNVWVASTSIDDMDKSTVKYITDISDNQSIKNVQMVKVNDNKFVCMWTIITYSGSPTYETIYSMQYVVLDANCNIIAPVTTIDGVRTSSCDPVASSDGSITWYVCEYTAPVFYTLSADGIISMVKIY
ncbi:MAG: DUF4214 domain-containing protein [Saccharofermentans sp.]|nr:DUF4214 domain-containing protein [Saccharofermentans sp.]